MKTTKYKIFKNIVNSAKANDDIWWDGFYWLDLTKKQTADILTVLDTKGCCKDVIDSKGRKAVQLPSGITVSAR